MAELTTDQRLSGRLLETLAELGRQHQVARETARTLDGQGPEAKHVAEVLHLGADRYGEMTDRLGELVEGLAAGTVFILDEVLLREVAESWIGVHGDGSTPAHLANLMLDELKTRGALR